MNNADLIKLEQEKENKLKKYKLDEKNIKSCREELEKERKIVSQEESDKLGEELYQFISYRNFQENETVVENMHKIKQYIYNGANLEYSTPKKGDFPLLLCARRNLINTFAILVINGANFNRGNNYQTTPVMTSARHGNKEILELLILLGADINAKCLDGDNALMIAKRHDQIECFEMLKKANAHFGSRNIYNETVRDVPSTQSFDFTGILTLEECLSNNTTYDDIQSLLNEAEQNISKLSSGIEIDEDEELEYKVRKREFKRIK